MVEIPVLEGFGAKAGSARLDISAGTRALTAVRTLDKRGRARLRDGRYKTEYWRDRPEVWTYLELERRLRYQAQSPNSQSLQAGKQARPCPLFPNRKLVLPVTSALQSPESRLTLCDFEAEQNLEEIHCLWPDTTMLITV